MEEKKFALLIDSDNISANYIKIILDIIGTDIIAVNQQSKLYQDYS